MARILRQVADRLEDGCDESGAVLFDINGNRVGNCTVSD